MAKKKAKLKQQLMSGTYDEPPNEVRDAADDYVDAKRAVANHREEMNNFLTDLIEKMKAAEIYEILIDDGEKRLILSEKDQVKIKARKKQKDDDSNNSPT